MAKYLEGILTSDWHLCGLQKHFTDHTHRTLAEIDRIYQYAVTHGIDHIFVGGDISDTPHMPYDVYIALVLFLKKYDGLINTYYIAGNHDFSDTSRTSMDLLNVLYKEGLFKTFHLFLSEEQRTIDNVPVNFLPYPSKESICSESPCLNLSHVTYNGALGDNGRKLRTNNEFIQDPRDFNMSGHIHLYQHLKKKRAVYCGTPFQKNFGESLPKGFVRFKARISSKDEPLQFKHKFIEQRPGFELRNVTITESSEFAQLTDSDAIRYKLFVDAGVTLPSDLRTRFPNITGGIFDLKNKKRADEDKVIERASHSGTDKVSKVKLRGGLTHFLRDKGFDKSQVKLAHTEVKKAMNELGMTS